MKGGPKYFAPKDRPPKEKEALETGWVYVNKAQYLEGVDPEFWVFQVARYQVCAKWLKDRKRAQAILRRPHILPEE